VGQPNLKKSNRKIALLQGDEELIGAIREKFLTKSEGTINGNVRLTKLMPRSCDNEKNLIFDTF